jgi:CO/xanthine dehydrogenase Mo-binding subunit
MKLSQVGRSVPLEDAYEKVTGQMDFTADLTPQGTLYAKILRSPFTHAKIVNINTDKAEALPGVEAILTYQDITNKEWMEESLNYLGPVLDDRVRFIGDDVAAVAAISEEIAEQALELIEVEYDELPSVLGLEEAMKPDAPQVCPHGNVREPTIVDWGDLEIGFKEADHIVEYQTTMEAQAHAPIGLNGCIAEWIGEKVTIWTCTQTPFAIRDVMAEYLEIPMNRVRVVGLAAGGSFGLWWLNNFHFLTVLLAKKARKTVKLILTREETFNAVKRRDIPKTTVKLGVKEDGVFTAIHMKHLFDNGAYGFKVNPYESISDLWHRHTQHGKFEFYGVSNNLLTSGCMRGVGDLTEAFCMEQVIDMAAEKIGMDPLEIRLKNHVRAGDPQRSDNFAFVAMKIPIPDIVLSSSGMEQCIKQGAEAIDWKNKWKGFGKPYSIDGSKRRAIGVGTASHVSGQRHLGSPAVFIKVYHDASVHILTGVGRCGQGVETTQAQIVAEELGIPAEMVKGVHGDTDACPWAQATVASTHAHITGLASRAAAADAKQKILKLAGTVINCDPSDIDIKNAIIFQISKPDNAIPITDVTNKILPADGTLFGPTIIGASVNNVPVSPVARMYMAHFVEIEVDMETGKIKLLDYVAATDSGTIINPEVAENQIIGGVIQAAGLALSERLIFDENSGQILNPNFIDYKLLRAADLCEIKVIFVEEKDPVGAWGIKGIGEGVLAPVPAAINSALFNATGIHFNTLPLVPEKILTAIKENERGL